jgi:hypothetical protein
MTLAHRHAVSLVVTLAACGAEPPSPASQAATDGAAAFEAELDTVPLMPSPMVDRLAPGASPVASAAPPPRVPPPRTHRAPVCAGTEPVNRKGTGRISCDLDRTAIQRPVRAAFGRIRGCYDLALGRDPTVQGRFAVTFTIDFDGVVRKACEARDEDVLDAIDDPEFARCVTEAFTALRFPELPPDCPTITVTYPVEFRPAE